MTCAAASIDDLDIATWQRMMDVNLNSVFYCLKYQTQLMKKQGRGGSIFLLSQQAKFITGAQYSIDGGYSIQ